MDTKITGHVLTHVPQGDWQRAYGLMVLPQGAEAFKVQNEITLQPGDLVSILTMHAPE